MYEVLSKATYTVCMYVCMCVVGRLYVGMSAASKRVGPDAFLSLPLSLCVSVCVCLSCLCA